MKSTNNFHLDRLIALARQQNYVVWVYPRLKQISINGGKLATYSDANHRLMSMLIWNK